MLVDYERSLIPYLSDTEAMREMTEAGLTEALFESEDCREIFSFAKRYWVESKLKYAVPRRVLETEFKQYFTVEGYPEETDEPIALGFIVGKIKERFRKTQIQQVIRDAADDIMNNPDAALSKIVTELSQIQIASGTSERIEVYGEHINKRIDEYYEKALPESRTKVFPLGWSEITEYTGGIRPGEFAVIGGFAGTGKSWVSCQCALEAARAGVKVYFASLENTKEMTLQRLDCMVSGVPFQGYDRGQLDRHQIDKLNSARDEILSLTNLIVDTPTYSQERTIFELYNRAVHNGAELFVGDQVSWVYTPKTYKEDWIKVQDIIEQIRDTTRSFKMASLWAVQTNRQSMKGKAKVADLSQFARSGAIEQNADMAFALGGTEEQKRNELMVLALLKARRCPAPMKWLLNWRLTEETDLSWNRNFDVTDL